MILIAGIRLYRSSPSAPPHLSFLVLPPSCLSAPASLTETILGAALPLRPSAAAPSAFPVGPRVYLEL